MPSNLREVVAVKAPPVQPGSVADEVTRKSQTALLVFHPNRQAAYPKTGDWLEVEPYAEV
jgi:hypothetical protein